MNLKSFLFHAGSWKRLEQYIEISLDVLSDAHGTVNDAHANGTVVAIADAVADARPVAGLNVVAIVCALGYAV